MLLNFLYLLSMRNWIGFGQQRQLPSSQMAENKTQQRLFPTALECKRILLFACSCLFLMWGLGLLLIGATTLMLQQSPSALPVVGNFIKRAPAPGVEVQFVFEVTSVVLNCSGLYLVLLGCLGMSAVVKQTRFMYLYFGIVVGAWLFLHILAGITFFYLQDLLLGTVRFMIKGAIQSMYDPKPEEQDVFSRLIDLVQMRLKCCGVDNVTDFHPVCEERVLLLENVNVTDDMSSIIPVQRSIGIPESCCVAKATSNHKGEYDELVDPSCTEDPTTDNSYIATPCWRVISEAIHSKNKCLLIGWGTLSGVLMMSSFLAFCLAL